MPATDSRIALLRACGLSFLVRAIVRASSASHRDLLHRGLTELINEFVPCDHARLVLEAEPPGEGALAFPLDARDSPCAALHVRLAMTHPSPDALDMLAAIATLLGIALESASEVQRLTTQNAVLAETLAEAQGTIIGASPALLKLLEMVRRVAPRDSTVLILGESGTGKELIARAVHENSARRSRPFVAINCAALTETLLESELFGHEKGAFTGAVAQKKGKLEVADGGTVFLDEIGELAPSLQAKLLRVLQQRVFERVGGTTSHPLDVRLIAATNRELEAETRSGRFRQDLFHRINVVTLRTPPLRDRREDIPVLAAYFLARSAAACNRRVHGFSTEAERLLLAYSWPGNVRELENAIERAVVLGDADRILVEDLPESLLESAPEAERPFFAASISGAKRDAIIQSWRDANGDYKIAARSLGIHPNSLLRLIRTLGLREILGSGAGT